MAKLVRYQFLVGNHGHRYSSPLGAQRCSNLVRAHVPLFVIEDFDTVNAMTNLVVQDVRKMDLPSWLPLRELSSWFDDADHTTAIRGRLQDFLGAKTKAVILGVAHGGAVPDIEHAESASWLRAFVKGVKAAALDCVLLHDRFIESKKLPEKSTFAIWWQTIERQVALVRGGVQPPLVPFRRLHGAQGRSGPPRGSPSLST